VVTEQDLKKAAAPDLTSLTSPGGPECRLQKAISETMTMSPVAISHHQTIEDTAEMLLVNRIPGLPVINQTEEVVGMITRSDLLRFILTTIGMGKDGIQFAVEVVNRPGCIKEVTDIMRDYGGRVGAVYSNCQRADNGYRQAYIRIYDLDQPSLSRLKEVLQRKVRMLYIINHKEKMSEIF
jgi:acetoin utilization protein AcuB